MITGKTWTINCEEHAHPMLHVSIMDGAKQITGELILEIGETGITTIQLLIDNLPRRLM